MNQEYLQLTKETIEEAVKIHERIGRERDISGVELTLIVNEILFSLQQDGWAEPRMEIKENPNTKMIWQKERNGYYITFHSNYYGLTNSTKQIIHQKLNLISETLKNAGYPVKFKA